MLSYTSSLHDGDVDESKRERENFSKQISK